VTPKGDDRAELLIDTTDAVGRCHDQTDGGLELVDISGIGVDPAFEPRELLLTRHSGRSHTVTVDDLRPHIVYNSTGTGGAGTAGEPWIEVLDIRSCLSPAAGGTLDPAASLQDRRAACAAGVHVYRIPLEPAWASRRTPDGQLEAPQTCHDITARANRIHCAGLNATMVFDVAGMFDDQGNVRGTPIPCGVTDADPRPDATTAAKVLDCALRAQGQTGVEGAVAFYDQLGRPQAEGWQFLGRVNHAGRPANQANNNLETPSDEEVAISHQADPAPVAVGDYLIVSDERGGGVVPGGGSCGPTVDNPIGNGGLHFYDMSRPGPERVFEHARMVAEDGTERPAVWIGRGELPAPTFCTVHVFHHVPDEQRIIMGYYSQGTKVLDYTIDALGRLHFDEVASFILPGAQTWVTNFFAIDDNPDGTRTYHLMANDIARGQDVFRWTHTPNPVQERTVVRRSGPERITTAVEVSRSRFSDGGAATVVLARADDYADALTGAPLAARHGGPILLTDRDRLAAATEAEIVRLGATQVVLLGGEAALSPSVAQALQARGLEVERIAGPTRFATAARIAAALGSETQTAFLAEGANADPARGWPDALSAASLAAATGRPVLLATRDALPADTVRALADLGIRETLVVGGSAAVSDAVVAQVQAAGHGPRRLAGATRYETSRAIYEEALRVGLNPAALWLATGRNWPDALAAGPVVAATGGTFLLIDGRDLAGSPPAAALLRELRGRIRHVTVLGGTAAVATDVVDQVRGLLRPEPQPGSTTNAATGVGGARPGSGSTQAGLVLAGLAMLPLAALTARRRRR
jgi:putative cell wall-binding protein